MMPFEGNGKQKWMPSGEKSVWLPTASVNPRTMWRGAGPA